MLLATKFHRPTPPPGLVTRARLARRLQDGLKAGQRLVLVSAPAGFGKTTCVSTWCESLAMPYTWLTLDALDNDPARFFTYLAAALQKIDPDLSRELSSLYQAGSLQSGPPPPVELTAAALSSDLLEAEQDFVLVLDDFHVIQEGPVLEVLGLLAANLPPALRLVLVTREDPNLPLARLRAHNQLVEIRAADLRFIIEEAAELLNGTLGLGLEEGEIDALENRTEGWAAGLQLAGLSLRDQPTQPERQRFIRNLSGSQRYYLNYLTEEVLSRQPPEIQDFLLQTSILQRLCGELCDAVTLREGSSGLLERLLAANLFLAALDDEGRWYRYHPLFAELLRSQLERQASGRLPSPSVLHQRAAAWHEQTGLVVEAMDHALAGKDTPRAMQLLERHARALVNQGYVKTVEDWVNHIPPEARNDSPLLNLVFAWMHLLRGSYRQVEIYLQQAAAAVDTPAASSLKAEWHVLQANLLAVQGKIKESADHAALALQIAQPDDHNIIGLARFRQASYLREQGQFEQSLEVYQHAIIHSRMAGNTVSELLAAAQLSLMLTHDGRLRQAANICQETIAALEQTEAVPPVAGVVLGSLGILYLEWNQLEQAREYLARAMHLSALGGHNASAVLNRITQARLEFARGDLQAVERALLDTDALLKRGAPAWLRPEIACRQVQLWLLADRAPEARSVLQALQTGGSVPGGAPADFASLARLRMALFDLLTSPTLSAKDPAVQGFVEEAKQLIGRAAAAHRSVIALQTRLLLAQLYAKVKNQTAALAEMDAVMAATRDEHHLRLVLDEGDKASALLSTWVTARTQDPQAQPMLTFARSILAAAVSIRTPAPAAAPTPGDLVEPLTERELAVLQLLARGFKYEEMADQLVISLNTVRFYVKEIYAKLQVNNRTRALEAARRAGLLP